MNRTDQKPQLNKWIATARFVLGLIAVAVLVGLSSPALGDWAILVGLVLGSGYSMVACPPLFDAWGI